MGNPQKAIVVFLLLSSLVLPTEIVRAAMTSTNYQVMWDSIGLGGSDVSSSASYTLRDTLGLTTSGGLATSTTYRESYGYRLGVFDETVTFAAYAEDRSTQVAATALSGATVTVTTTSGFLVGQRVAIVANEGASQVVAVGEILSIDGTSMALDALTTNGTTPTIDGSEDYVYRLANSGGVSLGTLSTSTVATSVIMWNADADVSQGYSVYLMEDGDITSSGTSMTIGDVADGAVTAGSSEYGAISSDASLVLSTFDTQDSPITTTMTQVASRSNNSYTSRDFITLKVGVSSALESGTYTNMLSLIFVGDY